MSKIPIPKVWRIEPASQCNLACTHCPTGTVDMPRGVMSETIFNLVLKELKRHSENVKIVVLYHGGEPLLNSLFYDMVAEIKKINQKIFIKTVTNGMALNERNSLRLVESGIDAIEVSLDGASAEESAIIRKNSNTEKIVSNIKGLARVRSDMGSEIPKISISTTQFINKNHATFPLQEAEPPKWLIDEFGSTYDFKATYAVKWPHMNVLEYDLFTSPIIEEFKGCDHVINTVTIRSNGDVVPCCYDLTSKLVMGNIERQSLHSIWGGDDYRRLRESLDNGNLYSICRNCAVVTPPIYLVPR